VKFGAIPVAEAENAVLAHGLRFDSLTLRKGQIVTAERRRALSAAGVESIVAAQLEPGDVGEDEAARRLAERLAGAHLSLEPPFTGRVNLFAREPGLIVVDATAIGRVNGVDEAITVATLAPYRVVAAGDMAATVKIIPFAAPGSALAAACDAVPSGGAVSVAPFRPLRFVVASTVLPGLKASVVAKTLRALEARLAPAGAAIVVEERVAHEPVALARALERLAAQGDALVIFGASAITDRRDVIPSAIEAIGGRIERFGMPVDPGNLLLLAARGALPIVGAPGCARSPKENGFDWVLQRILAGVPIGGADIEAMGVGGLLMEIASRPQPRLGDV
jgi:molybdenum cofactor cytidylyltransferase